MQSGLSISGYCFVVEDETGGLEERKETFTDEYSPRDRDRRAAASRTRSRDLASQNPINLFALELGREQPTTVGTSCYACHHTLLA